MLLVLQPRATFKFPSGKISFEERAEEEAKRALLVDGIVKGQVLNGSCAAHYKGDELKLRYAYKVSFSPKYRDLLCFGVFEVITACITHLLLAFILLFLYNLQTCL